MPFICVYLIAILYISYQQTGDKPSKLLHIDVVNIPEKFSRRVSTAIETGQLFGENRSAFVRECVDYFEPVTPTPSKEQFNEFSRKLCDRYPSLKDARKTAYWVSKYMYNSEILADHRKLIA